MSTQHTKGPWQVTMHRINGSTTYSIFEHVETSIAVNPRDYWPKGYEPPKDEYGYFQPDENMDCEKHRIDTARLIAAAPDLLEALQDLFDADMEHVLMGDGKDDQIEAIAKARAAIAKATGETK